MPALLGNNATTTLASGINSSVTSISIASAANFPSPADGEWFPLTVIDSSLNMEIMKVTARSGTTLTVLRGQEGTTARSFASGSRCDIRLTAGAFADAPGSGGVAGDFLDLPQNASPGSPSTGDVRLFGEDLAGRLGLATIDPAGQIARLQHSLATKSIGLWLPTGGDSISTLGIGLTTAGSFQTPTYASTSLQARMKRADLWATSASTTAIASALGPDAFVTIGDAEDDYGGFLNVWRWSPTNDATVAGTRGFCGLHQSTTEPTDTNIGFEYDSVIGMGWDERHSNIQFVSTKYYEGFGATFVDTGIPARVAGQVYEFAMYSPPGMPLTPNRSLKMKLTELVSGASFSYEFLGSSILPFQEVRLAPRIQRSAGGTSCRPGFALMNMYLESNF